MCIECLSEMNKLIATYMLNYCVMMHAMMTHVMEGLLATVNYKR